MQHLQIHRDDAYRLTRWLCSNLCVFAFLVTGLIVIGHGSSDQNLRLAQAEMVARASVTAAAPTHPHAEKHAVAPVGWRRTVDGWQHTSTWLPEPRPLTDWIAMQQAREPRWAQAVLAELRETPPLIFALVQITAIAAVVVLTQRQP